LSWESVEAPADVIIFEGRCAGARLQTEADLTAPVNALERDEDRDGRWRRRVNAQFAGIFQTLFTFLPPSNSEAEPRTYKIAVAGLCRWPENAGSSLFPGHQRTRVAVGRIAQPFHHRAMVPDDLIAHQRIECAFP